MIVEAMEGRTLFSVSVSQPYTGFYEIYGDETDDVIDVTVDMGAQTFTLDGTTYDRVSFISVISGGGADSISLTAATAGYIAASIDAGDGDDSVTVNFDASVWAGEGDDTIDLSDAYRGEVFADGGADLINVHGDCDAAEIYGGDGDDVIDATGNNYGVTAYGEAGADVIYGSEYGDTIDGGLGADILYGNDGNDTFSFGGDTAADQVDGGAGSDRLYSNGYEASIIAIEHLV